MTHSALIHRQVVANEMCIGCGACAFADPSVAGMRLDRFGRYTPWWSTPPEATSQGDAVCPFSDASPDENRLGESLFGAEGTTPAPEHDRRLGHYRRIWVGHAGEEGDFRRLGSSGGLTNWLLAELMHRGEVDAVIGVGELPREEGGMPLFGYQCIDSPGDLHRLAKSKYAPMTLETVLEEIVASEKRYAFVGVPCFVTAMRHLCREDARLAKRVRFCLAIVCGHLKSTAFAESLGWQLGIPPHELQGFDFRVKVENQPANRYAVEAVSATERRRGQVFDLYGTDWGLGLFKYKACDYCDDIAGETADATLGDAWLPGPVQDWRGTNILVVRHPLIESLLAEAAAAGRIALESQQAEAFVSSQAANYRHRHDGLSYRLYLDEQAGRWAPRKRIAPSEDALPPRRRRMMVLRSELREASHQAFLDAKQAGVYRRFPRQLRGRLLAYHYHAGSLLKHLVKQGLIGLRRFINIKV